MYKRIADLTPNEYQAALMAIESIDYDPMKMERYMAYEWLVFEKCRNGRIVAWMAVGDDPDLYSAVYTDTLTCLTMDEIDEQLLSRWEAEDEQGD